MRRALPLFFLFILPLAAQIAPIPMATALPSSPFFIRHTWYVGGAGDWDYLTLDAASKLLYVAHSQAVQVVDLNTGNLVAEIGGFREAHEVALDDTGVYGYVSDGPAGEVAVFERQTFKIESRIPIYCSPRSLVFEPRSKLVFAMCGVVSVPDAPKTRPSASHVKANQQQTNISGTSHVIVIDAASRAVLADIGVAGDFRFATPDGMGGVWVTVGPATRTRLEARRTEIEQLPPRIAMLDASAIAAAAQNASEAANAKSSAAHTALFNDSNGEAPSDSLVHFLRLPAGCTDPQGLAVDERNHRLFAACDQQQFVVLNANTGAAIAALTTGAGDDVVGYDAERELIFVANGRGYGSLTVIQQDSTTDSYDVIQNLPTEERARTLAVDASSGSVYLVTDFRGADLSKPGGIGTLKMVPVAGSFQVLVIGR